jgi:hypothetical protein
MNALDLRVQDHKTAFRPGEALEGSMEWTLDRNVEALELRLIWYTQGKGDADVSVEDARRFEAPSLSGSAPFRFTLPAAPYSFSGKLISLSWALEIVTIPGEDSMRYELALSPSGQEVLLPQPDNSTLPGGKRFSTQMQWKSGRNDTQPSTGPLEQRSPFDS